MRKLAYGDRLVGTMREALAQGVTPTLFAHAVYAALQFLICEEKGCTEKRPATMPTLDADLIRRRLEGIWSAGGATDTYAQSIVELVVKASAARDSA